MFPPECSGDIAKFLCYIADNSDRPKSALQNCVAAINALYKASGICSPCDDNVYSLKTALVS